MSKKALKEAIAACGYKQVELARRLGVERSSISQWHKRGVPRWHRDAVLKIAKEWRQT